MAWDGGSGIHGSQDQHGRAGRAGSDTFNGDACVNVRSVLDRLGARLQIVWAATMKESPLLQPPDRFSERPHVCGADQPEDHGDRCRLLSLTGRLRDRAAGHSGWPPDGLRCAGMGHGPQRGGGDRPSLEGQHPPLPKGGGRNYAGWPF